MRIHICVHTMVHCLRLRLQPKGVTDYVIRLRRNIRETKWRRRNTVIVIKGVLKLGNWQNPILSAWNVAWCTWNI